MMREVLPCREYFMSFGTITYFNPLNKQVLALVIFLLRHIEENRAILFD
jgi:hypothetical protein